MAKQKGIIKLKGTLGDITFYKSQDGYLAREKGGIDADRMEAMKLRQNAGKWCGVRRRRQGGQNASHGYREICSKTLPTIVWLEGLPGRW